jgi:hypothetical protein
MTQKKRRGVEKNDSEMADGKRKDACKKQESKQRTTNNKEMGEELKRVKQE